MKKNHYVYSSILVRLRFAIALCTLFILAVGLHMRYVTDRVEVIPTAKANSVYFDMTSGNLNFSVSAATANQITINNDWTGVSSVEGFMGQNLTLTHGVDPRTILHTEFANNQLPNTPANVAANKGNPSAFNAGGLAEFDNGPYLAIGFQGNVQANPYMVFYLNTTGRTNITLTYAVQDIDAGSNNAVSPVAIQYRVGETGLFTNIPDGYIADATDGGVAGRITNMTVVLPAAANNQSKVQVRLITTNAANSAGASTPDEWIGVNHVAASSVAGPSAASVDVSGRVTDPAGRGISGALVTMFGANGMPCTAVTSSFGYFHFSNVSAGQTYYFLVNSKRFSFTPRTISITDDLTDLNFVADQ